MRFNRLNDWLDWQASFHPREIDLGLERVREVADRLGLLQPTHLVISVAGTNGKGSSVAMLEAMLLEAGRLVGSYTSPHLHRYNERICVAGDNSPDEWILEAFDQIDRARGEISLSYFEFGTLAGLWIFARQRVDVAILEVGLGGRLDAVNIVDADIALITSIGIDHTEWLGEGRERISLQKAGIARRHRPLVCAEPDPPGAMRTFIEQLGSHYYQSGEDFRFSRTGNHWDWWMGEEGFVALPEPALPGEHQLRNASGAVAVCHLLPESIRPEEAAIRAALRKVRLAGRFERLDPGNFQVGFEVIFDLAHNPDGAQALAQLLTERKIPGKTYLLFGVMRDKDIEAMLEALASVADGWILSAPRIERALQAPQLFALFKKLLPQATGYEHADLSAAWQAVQSILTDQDRLVVTGSFYTVAEMRELILV